MKQRLLLFLATSLLAGCALMGRRESLAIHSLADVAVASDGARVPWQLTIEEPVAAEPVAGSRIALRTVGSGFGVYSGARWSDRAPAMLQTVLIRAFADTGRMAGVARPTAGLRTDFALLIDLRAFEVERRDGETVAIDLMAQFARNMDRRVLASRRFTARVPVEGRGLDAVVRGFDAAMAQLVPPLLGWTLELGEASVPGRDPAR